MIRLRVIEERKQTTTCRNVLSNKTVDGERHVSFSIGRKRFFVLLEKNFDLSRFFSRRAISQGIINTKVVVSGGFNNEAEVQSASILTDMTILKEAYE